MRKTEHDEPGYLRIVGAIHARPWAITSPDLDAIIAIVEAPQQDLEAVAARVGKPLDNSNGNKVENRDGVAVLHVEGPIFRYANIMTRVSGATSVQQLGLDFEAALQDPMISSIVLDINSPGGQVDGINEMADAIRAGSKIKPVTAYVGNLAASGGYWLASAAGKIVANESASLGSIGVIASIVDNRGAQERQGVKRHDIVSSQSPHKNQDPSTDAGRAAIQTQVDALADLFIGRVAQFRGVSVEQVSSDFGKGGVKSARAAIAAGMADALGNYESLLAQLRPKAKMLFPMVANYTEGYVVDPRTVPTASTFVSAQMAGITVGTVDDEVDETNEEAAMDDEEDCDCPPGTAEDDCDCDEEEGAAAMKTATQQNPPAVPTPADERARIAAILNCEEAKGREQLARVLALETDHTPDQAKKILSASPVAAASPNALEQRMAQLGNPKVGTGAGDTQETSTAAEVQRILSFVPKDRKVAVQ
jgi:signal peptide peptidase SppA